MVAGTQPSIKEITTNGDQIMINGDHMIWEAQPSI